MVYPEIVDDEEHLLISVFRQSFEKDEEELRVHAALIHHIPELPLVCQRGDEGEGSLPCRNRDFRRLSLRGITAEAVAVHIDIRLVRPVYLGALLFRSFLDFWIRLLKPYPNLLRVPLICPSLRFLRGEASALRIGAHTLRIESDAVCPFYELGDGLS